MANQTLIPAALAVDALGADARFAFAVAADAGFHGISFATNHAELAPDKLDRSARRHLKALLGTRQLQIDAIRVAGPRGGLADMQSIDRTLDNARQAFLLAADLGVKTVSLNVGNPVDPSVPRSALVGALRDLAQHADAANLILALGGERPQELQMLVKDVDYQGGRVNLDSGRLIAAGQDPLKTAEELADVIGQVTAADVIRAGAAVRGAYLGEGQLPVPEFLEILQNLGFRGPLVVDVRDLPDAADAARHAAHVLRRLFRADQP